MNNPSSIIENPVMPCLLCGADADGAVFFEPNDPAAFGGREQAMAFMCLGCATHRRQEAWDKLRSTIAEGRVSTATLHDEQDLN